MKDTSEAIKCFKAGLKINPDDAYNNLGINYLIYKNDFKNMSHNNGDVYLKWLYNELNNHPSNEILWESLISLKPIIKDDTKINNIFDKYSQEIINKTTIGKIKYQIIIYAYNLLNNKTQPSNFVKEQLKTDSNNIKLNYVAGLINMEENNKDKANKYFNKCINLYKGIPNKNKSKFKMEFEGHFKKIPNYNNIYIKYLNNDKNVNMGKRFSDVSDSTIYQWVKSDLLKIIETCNNNGIKIIIQSYPLKYHNLRNNGANKAIYDIKKENPSLLFVDNFKVFMQLNDTIYNYFDQSSGHPNEIGYGIMAKNVFDVIMKEKIFNIMIND